MVFSENIKKEVREKSAFQCCICQSVIPDVHHIIPQEEGGSDTIDNAAPLCPNCHRQLGNNPDHRKVIIQARDWWYKVCEKRFSNDSETFEMIREIHKMLQNVQLTNTELDDLKKILKDMNDKNIDNLTDKTKFVTASKVVKASTCSQEEFDDDFTYCFFCKKCGYQYFGWHHRSEKCPDCGSIIE